MHDTTPNDRITLTELLCWHVGTDVQPSAGYYQLPHMYAEGVWWV
jgi:hypothetical protein